MSRLSEPARTIRVLHLDDESSYLELTKIYLEESNPLLQIQSCIDPEQVISELNLGDFDCVLSDYLMDEMDGLVLASKIRESSDIPIIMYTGQGSEEVAELAFEIGIDDYIRKEAFSSHFQVLAKRIVSAVERKRTHDLLAESEEKYRRLWEDSSDGLVIVGKQNGCILDFNEEFTRQSGRDRVELRSLKLWDIQPSTARQSIREKFLEERDEGTVISTETQFQKPSGEVVDIDLLSREIKIGDREVFQSRCRDITEKKRYKERLEAIHSHASKLSQTKEEKAVSKFTLDGIAEIFGFRKMSFSLVQGDIIRPVDIRSDTPLSRTEIPLDGVGLIAKVARTGESMLISDVLKEIDYYMARESTRSELTVPVKIGDEVVAVINIESSELDAISTEDQRLVEIFAEHVASAISINRESRKLLISEEKYRSLFESTHEGVLISGPDGRYTSANTAAAAILGYDSPDDIIGLSAVDFDAEPEQRDEVYEALMEKGYITDYEHEINRKDGSRGLISANVTLHKTDDGGILRSEVFFRDITESKKLEERLRESEASLRLFMDSATDGFSLLDSDLNIVDINDTRVKMTPSTRESLIGRNIRELYPLSEDRMRNRVKILTRILETGDAETLTDVIRHPRFGEKDVMVRVFKVGEGLGIITTDITEIRKLEERLRKSEALYRELAERSIDVIYKVDLEGRLQYVSPSVESLMGHRPEELIGKPYLKFLQWDQRAGVVDALSEAVIGNPIQG